MDIFILIAILAVLAAAIGYATKSSNDETSITTTSKGFDLPSVKESKSVSTTKPTDSKPVKKQKLAKKVATAPTPAPTASTSKKTTTKKKEVAPIPKTTKKVAKKVEPIVEAKPKKGKTGKRK